MSVETEFHPARQVAKEAAGRLGEIIDGQQVGGVWAGLCAT
ncbi:MAG: hypothetical protein OXE84_13410 [Rhodobacteraceae bacterium]|nr:hypothetical protein [Paracoccaceae bacterium]MCY4198069.1 hypothetical protein [Paracoccaceae bacterium]